MIITRSPLRITLGGGGTDLPSYYREHGGFLIAAAIDKYVYVTVMRPFTPGIYLKYSKLEHVETADDVHHPIIREAIKLLGFRTPQVEITTLADIPAGTGLGSSGSFTTALLKALYAHRRRLLHPSELAELACEIEIERLKEPIGKQDQYIAAYGGLTCFTFHKDGKVEAEPLKLPIDAIFNLEDNLLLFFTGFSRSASSILADQHRTHARGGWRHAAQPALRQGARRAQPQGARIGRHSGVRRADARALGAQEAAHRRREQPPDRRVVRSWTAQRRARRQAGRRRRRRVPDVLRGGSSAPQIRDDGSAGLEEIRFRFDFEGTKVLFA